MRNKAFLLPKKSTIHHELAMIWKSSSPNLGRAKYIQSVLLNLGQSFETYCIGVYIVLAKTPVILMYIYLLSELDFFLNKHTIRDTILRTYTNLTLAFGSYSMSLNVWMLSIENKGRRGRNSGVCEVSTQPKTAEFWMMTWKLESVLCITLTTSILCWLMCTHISTGC